MSDLIVTTEEIKAIDVVGAEVVSDCNGLCSPENFFECIESCKICGKLQ